MSRDDWLLFIGFILIIFSMFLYVSYSYTENVNKCTSDPLKYAIEKIGMKYNPEYDYDIIEYKKFEFLDEEDFFNITISEK